MRILFTSQPAVGHWHPLVPIARALEQAGHEVAFATTPDICAQLAANGFRCFPVGRDETPEETRERLAHMAQLPADEKPGYMWPTIFAGIRVERTLSDLIEVIGAWQPDVLVRESVEFSGCIAAEYLGLPHATVQVVAHPPRRFDGIIAPPLNKARASVGLPPDPQLDMLYRYLFLSPLPPRFHDPALPMPPTTHYISHNGFDRSHDDDRLPEWVGQLPAQPTVYATLGTVNNHLTPVLQAILDGLREEPINLILTIGRDRDPAEFGPQPANVRIESYIPQSLLLPYCDLVITHGGSGTVKDALSHALPMVIMPIAADQPVNARRCAALGVARVVDADQRTPEAIREATLDVLRDPSYRQQAERIRDEMQALPGLDYVITLLERLAAERAPLIEETR